MLFKANQLNTEQTICHKRVIKQLQLRNMENERDCHCTFKSLCYNLLHWQTNDQNQNLSFTSIKKIGRNYTFNFTWLCKMEKTIKLLGKHHKTCHSSWQISNLQHKISRKAKICFIKHLPFLGLRILNYPQRLALTWIL